MKTHLISLSLSLSLSISLCVCLYMPSIIDTFALLRQFQLYVGVPAITLNGGAGGVQLLGSLGANLDAVRCAFSSRRTAPIA
jgi:hypothetical protein